VKDGMSQRQALLATPSDRGVSTPDAGMTDTQLCNGGRGKDLQVCRFVGALYQKP
jgi:hypothetical protein